MKKSPNYSPSLYRKVRKKTIMIMKLSVLFLMAGILEVSASLYSQKAEISLNVQNESIRMILSAIEKQSGFRFFYRPDQIDLNRRLSLNANKENIESILNRILRETNLKYRVMDNNLIVIIPAEQPITIKGQVLSEDGQPLPGANIIIKGTATGTVADKDGNFSLDVITGQETLVVSFLGYMTQEMIIGGQTSITIALVENISTLDEIVVVGYGTQKKSVVTGAIAKVDATELQNTRDLRVEQALQGRTAGVMIMNNSGQPGDDLTIRIRGVGTNRDPDPLFLIDGLPVNKSSLDYLNTSDIESIEVLKDASSAAIYGTRGANGVIMITTKQGKKSEKISVTYDGYYGVQNPWRNLDMLNTKEYIEIFNESNYNDGKNTPIFSDAAIDTMIWDTDWQDAMYNYNAPKQSHTLALSGGGENSTFSSSLSYYSQDGIIAKGKSQFDRTTFRLSTTQKVGRLKFNGNLTFADIKKKGIDANNQYGIGINQALNMPPIVPVQYDNGVFGTPNDFNLSLQEITNPVALLHYLNRAERTDRAIGNVAADIKIIKGLVFRTNFGAEYSYNNVDEYVPVYYIDATHRNDAQGDSSDYVTKQIHKYVRWNWDNTLNYNLSVQKHNLTVLLGMTLFKEWDEPLYVKKENVIFNDFEHAYLDNALNTQTIIATNGYSEHTLASYFGRLNYNFAEKYLLEAVLRIDGSSRFGSANRYAKFPAFSAGWVVSKEGFFPKNDIISFMKIRSSWGQNGSENIPDFRYVGIMINNVRYYYGGEDTKYNGIRPEFVSNAGLRWETSQQFDIGTDMALLSNRVTFAFDYYNKKTIDWLIEAPAPAILGNDPPYVNGGSVRNSGIEVELGYKNNLTHDLFLSLMLTAASNNSEVLDIPNQDKVLMGGTGIHGQNDIIRMEVGGPMGYFYGYKTDGIFQDNEEINNYTDRNGKKIQTAAQPGDLKFLNLDSAQGIGAGDRTNIGNPYPKFTAGLNINVEYKGIDLYMFWYSALGHQIYMANRRADLLYSNYTTDVLDRWQGKGTSYDEPRVTKSDRNGNLKKASDYFVKDADFLRLKAITLGYTLPVKITSFIKVQKIRLYITSENLLTFTKYPGMEVEVGGTPLGNDGTNPIGVDHGVYPLSKTFIGGVNIVF
jgi:TonB-linked SusC/RagA family outer membrane protein